MGKQTKKLANDVADGIRAGIARAVRADLADTLESLKLKHEFARAVTRRSTEGQIRRDDGMDRAERHADPAWLRAAYLLVRKLAKKKPYFTTADVWEAGLAQPHEPRALGPVMVRAERDGLILATKEWRETSRPSRHCAPVRVWRSLLLVPVQGAA